MSDAAAPTNRFAAAALNLLWPGLGLLRIGAAAPAMILAAVPFAALLLGFAVRAGDAEAVGAREAWAAAAAATLLAAAAGAALAWKRSARAVPRDQWWTRWPGLLLLWLAAIAAGLLVPNPAGYLKQFHVPAESMAPTLERNARLIARMGVRPDIRRGDILIVRSPAGAAYVQRVAALPGDRIALRGGIVYLNGRAVPQRPAGTPELSDGVLARRFSERFPDEEGEHEIYDAGRYLYDDFPETLIRPGHIFLLGDNRDRAADSRVPPDDMGLDQVRVQDVRGRVMFKL
jgi:signal peptidase I